MDNSDIQWNIFLNDLYEKAKSSPRSQINLTPQSEAELTPSQLEQLKQVNATLTQPLHYQCSQEKYVNKLTIKGNNVKTSQLPKIFECGTDQTKLNLIEIFACDTIFFDQDVDLTGSFSLLSVIAPTWHVKGNRTISLNGTPAEEIYPDKAPNPGENGLPGIPGNPAGSFFAMGQKFINGENLRVLANGGKGSKGQDGADGITGAKGEDANYGLYVYDCYEEGSKWYCKGTKGQKGGQGGNGGTGGYGGASGDIKFINLKNETVPVQLYAINGCRGGIGLGGKGGRGGEDGDSYEGDHLLGWDDQNISNVTKGVAPSGKSGIGGINAQGMLDLQENIKIDFQAETILNDYKSFLMSSLNNDFLRDQSNDFLQSIMNDPRLQIYNSCDGLVQEFDNIEQLYNNHDDNVDFLPLYEEILQHILSNPPKNKEEAKTMSYLYTTVLSKVCALQKQKGKNFIPDLQTFLDVCLEDITKVKEKNPKEIVEEYTEFYGTQIEDELTEITTLINQHIKTTIENINTNVEHTIKKLSLDIPELQSQNLTYNVPLAQARSQMKDTIIDKVFGEALSDIADVISFLGPLGMSVKNYTDVENKVSDYFVTKVEETANKFLSEESLPTLKEEAEQEYKEVVEELQSFLSKLSAEENNEDVEILTNNLKYWKGSQKELIEMFDEGIDNIGEVPQVMKNSLRIMLTSFDLYRSMRDNEDRINLVSSLIEQREEMIEDIKASKDQAQTLLISFLDNVRASIEDLQNGSSLDMKKWNVEDTLTGVKKTLEDYKTQFALKSEINQFMDIIMDSVNKIMSVFENIQIYEYQKTFADYINLIGDTQESEELEKYKLLIKSNVLLQTYRQMLPEISQFVFPLVDRNLPDIIKTSNNVDEDIQKIVDLVEDFKTKLTESSRSIIKHDGAKHQSKFYDDSPIGAFHIWSNATYHDSIAKLLSGEEVLFYADPNYQPTKNGVKFTLIDVLLKSPNDENQNNLDEIVKDFEVVLTHMGNSYYKCNDKTFMVTTESNKFEFDFKKVSGDHQDFNEVAEKIRDGDYLLSPYTTWKMQLINTRNGDYETLMSYGDGADLHLVGKGEFYEEDSGLCGDELGEYYQFQSVTQEKEDDCLKILSSSMFDKNNACYLNYNNQNGTGFYNPFDHIRQRRSIGDDIPYYTNDSPKFSSPINDFFKWVNEKVRLLSYESSTTSNFWNPELAFNQMNSLLILAPFVLHLALTPEKEEMKPQNEEKMIEVELSRKKVWVGFLDDFQKLLKTFNIKQRWVEMILEDRFEEIEAVGKKATEEDLERIERNLVTFLVDFLDDVMYDDGFIGIRSNKKFNAALKEATRKVTEIENFENLFKMSQCSY